LSPTAGWTCGTCPEGYEGGGTLSDPCRTLCDVYADEGSSLGCDFWSLDLDNRLMSSESHIVVLANPHSELSATIRVSDGHGERIDVTGWPDTVAPGEAVQLVFARNDVNTVTGGGLYDPAYIQGTMIGDQSFRIETSLPVAAYQHNAVVLGSNSADSSLLLPAPLLGTDHIALSHRHWEWDRTRYAPSEGFIAVVATEDDTELWVTPTAVVVAGHDKVRDEAIDRIEVGTEHQLVLARGEYLVLATEGPDGEDLTGSHIVSSHPVAVFGGQEQADFNAGGGATEHLQHQVFATPMWGSEYLIAHGPFSDLAGNPTEVGRVVAGDDGITLSTDPTIEGVDGVTLDRAEFVEFEFSDDFMLTATGPIMPVLWLAAPEARRQGHPSMVLAVPKSRWLTDYALAVPSTGERYLTVIAPAGAEVTFDGEVIATEAFSLFASDEYGVARFELGSSTQVSNHRLSAAVPFSVTLQGNLSGGTYATVGGLFLGAIE